MRVPLNTARKFVFVCCFQPQDLHISLVLAVQNMEASGTIAKDQDVEFNALGGSLSMMSKGKRSFRES